MEEISEIFPIRERDDNAESLKKYPKHRHSVELKLDYIKRVECGESAKSLSEELGVARCTIRSWVKNKQHLLGSKQPKEQTEASPGVAIKEEPVTPDCEAPAQVKAELVVPPKPKPRPRPRPKPKPKCIIFNQPDVTHLVNNSLIKWYDSCRQRGIAVTRERFELKTTSFFKHHGIENFYVTDEWVIRWMKHHGFRLLSETIESIPINQITDIDFQIELKNTFGCTDYDKCQVFNCTVLSWSYKSLPLTLGHQVEKNHPQDDYIKVFSFTNADESFRIPLICTLGTGSKKCWKNEFDLSLYSTESDADELDSVVFAHWLKEQFLPQIMKFLNERNVSSKVILMLDNEMFEAAKLSGDFGGIKIIIVPKTSSFLLRPFDSGLVPLMKNCKRSFLKKLSGLVKENPNVPLIQHLDSINNAHFLAWVKSHWRKGPDSIHEATDLQLVRNLPGGKALNQDTVERWLRRCQPEIIEKNQPSGVMVKNENDRDTITPEEATSYLNKLIPFFNFHNILVPAELAVLINARQRIKNVTEIMQRDNVNSSI